MVLTSAKQFDLAATLWPPFVSILFSDTLLAEIVERLDYTHPAGKPMPTPVYTAPGRW